MNDNYKNDIIKTILDSVKDYIQTSLESIKSQFINNKNNEITPLQNKENIMHINNKSFENIDIQR